MKEKITPVKTMTDNSRESEILNHIRCVSGKEQPEIRLDMAINNWKVEAELDTGVLVSLISKKQQEELLHVINLVPADVTLRANTGEMVSVVGKCFVNVGYQWQEKQGLPLCVVEVNGPALFCREWLAEIEVDWHSIHTIILAEKQLMGVLNQYDSLFNDELGTVKGVKAVPRVKPDNKPKFFKRKS